MADINEPLGFSGTPGKLYYIPKANVISTSWHPEETNEHIALLVGKKSFEELSANGKLLSCPKDLAILLQKWQQWFCNELNSNPQKGQELYTETQIKLQQIFTL